MKGIIKGNIISVIKEGNIIFQHHFPDENVNLLISNLLISPHLIDFLPSFHIKSQVLQCGYIQHPRVYSYDLDELVCEDKKIQIRKDTDGIICNNPAYPLKEKIQINLDEIYPDCVYKIEEELIEEETEDWRGGLGISEDRSIAIFFNPYFLCYNSITKKLFVSDRLFSAHITGIGMEEGGEKRWYIAGWTLRGYSTIDIDDFEIDVKNCIYNFVLTCKKCYTIIKVERPHTQTGSKKCTCGVYISNNYNCLFSKTPCQNCSNPLQKLSQLFDLD